MIREIKSPKGAKVKSPTAPKSEEHQLSGLIKYMIEQMQKIYKNQIFNELNKSTVEKFADAQAGNFAVVFLSMAKRIRSKLLKRFDDDRLDGVAKSITGKVDKRNADIFYKSISKKIGISKKELEATEGLTYQINAYKLETAQWIKKIRDETLEQWTASTLRSMAEGKGLPEIMEQFDDMTEKSFNPRSRMGSDQTQH